MKKLIFGMGIFAIGCAIMAAELSKVLKVTTVDEAKVFSQTLFDTFRSGKAADFIALLPVKLHKEFDEKAFNQSMTY